MNYYYHNIFLQWFPSFFNMLFKLFQINQKKYAKMCQNKMNTGQEAECKGLFIAENDTAACLH